MTDHSVKRFKIKYDGIGLYDDVDLTEETFSVMLEKDSVIPGRYVNEKTILFGDPYNVYCSKLNVEETNISQSEYEKNKHQYDQTVIIKDEDVEQLEEEEQNDEYIVVDAPAQIPPAAPAQNDDYNEEDDDDDESSQFIPSPKSRVGMPPPFTPPANANAPPSLNQNDSEEMKSIDMDADIINGINHDYGNNLNVANNDDVTTGNVLEDCDNLMRIYRNLSENDKERELVYKEFWQKYEMIRKKKPHLLLQIPTRVRGFLEIMRDENFEPYKQDRIMMHVLSRNGLLEEPDYITNRYLYTYFIQFEIFNYFKWFASNLSYVSTWMFLFLWLLILAQIIHIGIDFGRANPWRALLMECLVPLTFIASITFVDTPFTANILRTLLEDKCAALCTIYGRVSLNLLIMFFCFGSLEATDAFLLFAVFLCAIWTFVIFISWTRLRLASNYVRIATGSSDKLREKFALANENCDGVLTASELRSFFKSYNQIVPMWQIELMISQYDVHRDGGLRFEALQLWFEKVPINHITRYNLLHSKSTFDSYMKQRQQQMGMMTTSGGPGGYGDGASTGGMGLGQPSDINRQFSDAEKEWIGLAGRKYMNQ